MSLHDKQKAIQELLRQYGRVAVAFSGGADSSLLLRLALDTLGLENVLALTARSCLLKKEEIAGAETWQVRHSQAEPFVHEFVDIDPLSWDEFVRNPEDRCYLCKLQVYRLFFDTAHRHGFSTLVDGTNSDDMNSTRPGLRAISELSIGTPLAAAGMTKGEVRVLSREMGLDTWDKPSASCLATRIPVGLTVTRERIGLIEKLELYLEGNGFKGCRVRLDNYDAKAVTVQVLEKDMVRITESQVREGLLNFLSEIGVQNVFLDLKGR